MRSPRLSRPLSRSASQAHATASLASLASFASLALLTALAAASSGCPAPCGTGTVDVDGACVPAGAPLSCGPGTRAEAGRCVPACAAGLVFDGDRCVDPAACAPGTIALDEDGDGVAACTAPPPCPVGQVFIAAVDGGAAAGCQPGSACPAPTLPAAGLCQDPALFVVDVPEGPEPNDPIFGEFAPTPIALPALGEQLVIGGTIGPQSDLDDNDVADPDEDAFAFAATAGTRFRIETLPLGVASIAVTVVMGESVELGNNWLQILLPIDSRAGAHDVVLPLDGDYLLIVNERDNFITRSLLSGFPATGAWNGSEQFTWAAVVTLQPEQPPVVIDQPSFAVDGEGRDAVTYDVVLAEPTFIRFSLEKQVLEWSPIAHFQLGRYDFFEDQNPETLLVPAGGFTVTVTSAIAGRVDTPYTLIGEEIIPVTLANLDGPPVDARFDVDVDDGVHLYRLDIAAPTLLELATAVAPGEAPPFLRLGIALNDEFAARPVPGASTVRAFLEPGVVQLFVNKDVLGVIGPLDYTLDVGTVPFETLAAPLAAGSEASTTFTLAPGAERYFVVALDAFGTLDVEAAPVDGDIALGVGTPGLLQSDGTLIEVGADAGAAGAPESVSLKAGAGKRLLHVRNVGAAGVDESVTLTARQTPLTPVLEVEPNTLLSAAQPVGDVADGADVVVAGDLALTSTLNFAEDHYGFTLAQPGVVTFVSEPLTEPRADMVLRVLDEEGALLITDFSLGYPATAALLDAGSYVVQLSAFTRFRPTDYILTTSLALPLACFPAKTRCEGPDVAICAADGTGETVSTCSAACTEFTFAAACGALDEVEPNDEPLLGQRLDIAKDAVHATLLVDEAGGDWYAVGLDEDALADVVTRPSPADDDRVDTVLEIFAVADLVTPVATNDDAVDEYAALVGLPLAAGEYFIHVSAFDGAVGAYRLELSTTAPPPPPPPPPP